MTIDTKALRELLADTGPLAWGEVEAGDDWYDVLADDGSEMGALVARVRRGVDAAFVARVRNQLPAILDRLEKLEAVAKAARVVCAHAREPGQRTWLNDKFAAECDAIGTALAALERE